MIKISYEEFERVELRSGTVVAAEEFPKTRTPAFKVWVDFGQEIGILKTSAQITKHYNISNLIGKSVIGCINLEEKNIAGFTSQFLLVGFNDSNNEVCLASIDFEVPNGSKLF